MSGSFSDLINQTGCSWMFCPLIAPKFNHYATPIQIILFIIITSFFLTVVTKGNLLMLTDVKHHDYMQNPHVGMSVIKQVKLGKTQTAKYSKLPG